MRKAILASLLLMIVSISAEAALIRWPLDFYAGYSRWFDNNASGGFVRLYDGNTTLLENDGHSGTDLKGGGIYPANIRAGGNGYVYQREAGCADVSWGCGFGFGNNVRIEHSDGMVTIYAHMLNTSVRPLGNVTCGDIVGLMGNSGSSDGRHLHLEFRRDRYLPARTFDPFNGVGNIGLSYWTNQNGSSRPVNPSMTCY